MHISSHFQLLWSHPFHIKINHQGPFHLSLCWPQKCQVWPGSWADITQIQLSIMEYKRKEREAYCSGLFCCSSIATYNNPKLATPKRVRTSAGTTHWNYQASLFIGLFLSSLYSVPSFSSTVDFSPHSGRHEADHYQYSSQNFLNREGMTLYLRCRH